MRINNIVDIHSHVLPGVDDGAKNIAESLQLLADLKMQGVGCVYATPHFYVEKQDFSEYIQKTDAAYAELKAAMSGMQLPEIRRGYEIRLFRGISTWEHLKQLYMENTHYLLIELPYAMGIENWMVNELYNMQFTVGLKPIIAHIERYFGYSGFDQLFDLVVAQDVRTQITSSAVMASLATRKKIFCMVRDGWIHFIASDAHSMQTRRGMFLNANDKLAKKCGEDTLRKLYARSRFMVHYKEHEI